MRLILIRHAESHWNEAGRVQGFSDPELNSKGREQAEKIAQSLRQEELAAIYASPLQRALETARAIARAHHLEVITDPDLREMNIGALEGLTIEELRAKHSESLREWREGNGSFRMPGGESLEELQHRAWLVVEKIWQKHPEESVVLVSHTFTNISIICRALGLRLVHFRRLRQDVGAISILDFNKQGIYLALLNDTCHLMDRGTP